MPRLLFRINAITGAIALFLVAHNFGLNLLPYAEIRMEGQKIRPVSPSERFPAARFGYSYNFRASTPDTEHSARSRVRLTVDGVPLGFRQRTMEGAVLVGGGRWAHVGSQIVFSSLTNADPRTDGRTYAIQYPIFYTITVGRLSVVFFVLSVALSYFSRRGAPRPRPAAADDVTYAARREWRWHLLGAAAVFAAGLYCNTGTLSPYANTYPPYVDEATGYLYNTDHAHFKVLFEFVDGADREVWDRAIMFRRILFPVIAWPFMKLGGFEVGGAFASIVFNVAALLFTARWLKSRIGERGAKLAAWLMAINPGAAYWGGLPYPYALIIPGSLLCMVCLYELAEATGLRLVAISAVLGLLYLGYDLIVFFLPASVLVLVLRRRWRPALATTVLQVLPILAWVAVLSYGLDQPLDNSNSHTYRAVVAAYREIGSLGLATWWSQVSNFGDVGIDVFFGSNFIFLPIAFLGAVALNPISSRIRFSVAEKALIATAVGLFLFNNLSPIYSGWYMGGTWISRLYQPIYPALLFYLARWWQNMPPQSAPFRAGVIALLAGTLVGNALIMFGPILNNPLRLSEYAFYKFYDHTENHGIYSYDLKLYGRRPIGFPQPQK